MIGKQDIQDELCTAEEAALVNQLVAFVKARFVYPETNDRVSQSRELFLENLEKFHEDRTALEISARRDHLRTSSGRVQGATALLEWFRDCMEKSALRTIRFERGVGPESLQKLVNGLRDNAQRRDGSPSFEDLWPETLPGIVLREQEFLGGYHDEDLDEVLGEGSVRAVLESPGQGAQTTRFIRNFQFTDAMLERLRRIEKLLSFRGMHDAPEVQMNLVEELVEALPAEVIENPETSQELVEKALEEFENTVSKLLLGAENVTREQLQQTMRQLAGRLFRPNRTPQQEEEEEEEEQAGQGAGQNRPEDRGEDLDDLGELLAAIANLPVGEVRLDPADTEMQGEVLHVCLRRLSATSRDAAVAAVCEKIRAILEQPGPEALWVLDQYVHKALDPGHNRLSMQAVRNVMEHLGNRGMLPLLRICGSLARDKVVEQFPHGFLYFLDSLDAGREADQREFLDALRRIGDKRIRRAESTLVNPEALLREDRLDKLFSMGGRELLPIARLLARSEEPAAWKRVAHYLKDLGLESIEATPLRVVDPVEKLPSGFLENLCTSEIEGKLDPNLTDYAGFLLRSYVESLPDDDACVDRKAYAILSLQKFPGRETGNLIRELMKGRGPFGMIRRPKPIRDAVKVVLQKIGGVRS